jgi:hypothetical protein
VKKERREREREDAIAQTGVVTIAGVDPHVGVGDAEEGGELHFTV